MAAANELDSRLYCDQLSEVVFVFGRVLHLVCFFQFGDISFVVLRIVKLHDFARDNRLQRVEVVGKVGEFVTCFIGHTKYLIQSKTGL